MRAAVVTTLCVLIALIAWSGLRESQRAASEALAAVPRADVAAAPPEPSARAAASRTHIVAAGDTLASLAQRYYGDARRAGEIFGANSARIADPAHLPVGATLAIP